MKAMVLCAGLGTRLRPLTEEWPKPAMPLLGVPLLRLTLATLRRASVQTLGINTHHLPERMAEVAERECERIGVPLTVSHEPVLQGTGGGIRGLRRLFDDGDFVVSNGDVLYPLDLETVIDAHRTSGAAATMVLLPMPAGEKYAAVECDAAMEVRRIAGLGPGGEELRPWHFTGVHVMSPAVFDFMSASGAEDINRDVYPRMLAAGLRVRGQVSLAYWSDLGTPARYLATQTALLQGAVSLKNLGDASPLEGVPDVGQGLRARRGALLRGRCSPPLFADLGAHLEAGAEVGPAVYLGAGSHVRPGARLQFATVFERTEIERGEQLNGVLAWGEHRITASST